MKLKDIDVNDDKQLIAWGEDFFQESAKEKRKFEQQWLLTLAFIAGDQLVTVNEHTGRMGRIVPEQTPPWIIHVVENRLLPLYRNMTAKLTKGKPRPSATAASREESDIQAARAAVKLEENHWKTLKLNTIHPEMVSWLISCGNGFYKQFWNPEKGDNIVDLSNMDPEAGTIEGTGKPKMKLEAAAAGEPVDFRLGDTDLILRSPFNVYPQPGKTKIRDMRIVGDAEVMDVSEVKERYGKDVESEKDSNLVRINHAIGNANTLTQGGLGLGKPQGDDNSVVVKELYVLPCSQFKDGAVITWANNVLLKKEDKCPEIPLTHIGLIDVPGRFWCKGVIEDVIPVQQRWNELRSKIEMHNDYYNDPPIIYDPERIDINDWTTEPGLMIPDKAPARGGIPAQVLQVPMLDPAIFKELEVLDQQFEVIPAMHKVSFGKDSSNAKSGVAISFLQEKDEDIIRPMVDSIETGYAEVFRRDFKLCQENYNEDRGFAIVGEDNEVEWIEFKRANLDAEIDVGVEPGSAMPKSLAAKQAFVMDMLNAGFFTDPRTGSPDFAKALKYLEFGSVSDIYEEASLDNGQAKRENLRMKEGQPAQAEYWHNHEVHLYEHNRLRKTGEFEEYPDDIKGLYQEHISQHEAFLAPPKKTEEEITDTTGGNEAELTAAQADAVLQELQQTDPQAYDFIMSLPEDQQVAAVMEVMQQTGLM